MKKNVLKNLRVLCFTALTIISFSVAFAAIYRDENGVLRSAPGRELFESDAEWHAWMQEMHFVLVDPSR